MTTCSVLPVLLAPFVSRNFFQLVVSLSEQWFIEREFSAVHSLEVRIFGSNLLHEIRSIVFIDRFDSLFQPSLFFIIVFLILVPHLGLYIDVGFLILFPLSLLNHLLVQEISHFFLIRLDSLQSFLFHIPLICFSFFFIPSNHLVLPLLFLVHLVEDAVGHFVHELLCSSFSLFHFISPVILLFI